MHHRPFQMTLMEECKNEAAALSQCHTFFPVQWVKAVYAGRSSGWAAWMGEGLLPEPSGTTLTAALQLQANIILSSEVCVIELVCIGSRELSGKVLLCYFLSNSHRDSSMFVRSQTLKQRG